MYPNFDPKLLEFENGKLVKYAGERPEYMNGYKLLWLVREMAVNIRNEGNGCDS